MPGYIQQPLSGYLECEYSSEWPGLQTDGPNSRIPPGACFNCQAQVVRNRLTPQPTLYPITGLAGAAVTAPTLASGENICAYANLRPPGQQQGFTVIITNVGVYIDFVASGGTAKTFTKIYTFSAPTFNYARFGTCVIGDVLYFSTGSALGVYALSPVFTVIGAQVTNAGGYFSTPPSVVFSDGGGTGATGTATLSSTNLASITVTAPGSGYLTPPLINLNGGSSTGPLAGQQTASAVAVLSSYPTGYVVKEISAFTGVARVNVTAAGSGYVNPTVAFIGGGGSGADATAIVNSSGNIVGVTMNSPGQNYTSIPTVQIIDANGTSATATANLFQGQPFIGGDFMATMAQRLILGNIIGGDGNNTVSLFNTVITNGGSGYSSAPTVDFVGGGGVGAAATAGESGGVVNAINFGPTPPPPYGTGYSSTPQVNLLSNSGTGATAIAQLGIYPQAASTTTKYPDYIQATAPNAYSYWDPDYEIAPGFRDQLTEAKGLICSLNVDESVCWIGHNGGLTEMTPNTTSAELPFSLYPLWSADQGPIVLYGSMAQYGTTLCFLGLDSAYTFTPSGLTDISQKLSSIHQNALVWQNGQYPLQGLYGSIVDIEGELHYLIAVSSDTGAGFTLPRISQVYDYNLQSQNWHLWQYINLTITCPIYQSYDLAIIGANSTLAKDSWILGGMTSGSGNGTASVLEFAALDKTVKLINSASPPSPVQASLLSYNFRQETPSIARMQSERRILVEYENLDLAVNAPNFSIGFTYQAQEDPTQQTGTVINTLGQAYAGTYVTAANGILNQVLTFQVDFPTFTGVAIFLTLTSTSPVSIVRVTQIADLPKAQVP